MIVWVRNVSNTFDPCTFLCTRLTVNVFSDLVREFVCRVDTDTVHRRRRATSLCTQSKPVPVCTLILIADYRYYTEMGGSSLQRTTSYIVGFCFSVIYDSCQQCDLLG